MLAGILAATFGIVAVASAVFMVTFPQHWLEWADRAPIKLIAWLFWISAIAIFFYLLYLAMYRPPVIDFAKFMIKLMVGWLLFNAIVPVLDLVLERLESSQGGSTELSVSLVLKQASTGISWVSLFYLMFFFAAYAFAASPYGREWATREPG